MDAAPARTIEARCAVVGGGPAGMMTGYLLARAGADVVVLEKHKNFLRDFRGDTIHPSTLEVLDELGLAEEFLKLPHQKTRALGLQIGGERFTIGNFAGLKFPYVAFIPQWDFLDFLADRARELPRFRLEMNAEGVALLRDGDVVTGVRAETPDGPLVVHADLVIAADGRGSDMRAQTGLRQIDIGAPMDVMWFRMPRRDGDPPDTMGSVGGGALMAMIARGDYWQCGYVIAKGSADIIRTEGIASFRKRLVEAAPIFADRADTIESMDDVKLLSVSVDRLEQWSRPGLLFIGDAAHAMSPVGGVGINLAIQDAVAAANILAEALRAGPAPAKLLRKVQERRLFPTRVTQRLQVMVQNRVLRPILAARGRVLKPPLFLRVLDHCPLLQRIPARIVGVGVRPEHVRKSLYG
jgi:2-polyprenyl-6-methoxyphenol hydroxylase-like FAD-dependent oxidoreductase